MSSKRNRTSFCRSLLLAASLAALTVSAAHAQENLENLNDRILENPQDAELNLRYAHAAEDAGKLRLALAAYERVLINDSSNVEARRGYERVRRMIEPPYTTLNTELGVRWDSNATNSAFEDGDAYSLFARATLVDERPIGPTRWRSIVNLEGERTPEFEQLDNIFLGAQTGPLLYVGPHLAALPAIGVATAALDDKFYFNEVNLGVTVEGRNNGMSYWSRLRGGWRSYSEHSTADDGPYAELMAGLSIPRVAADGDTMILEPWVRWSDIEGSTFNFFSGGDTTPGQYVEYGLDATYKIQLNDYLIVAAGALVRQRQYSETTFAGDDRSDTYVAPETSLTFTHILPCDCGVKLSYQYRHNDSNDDLADFNAHQVALSVTRRF